MNVPSYLLEHLSLEDFARLETAHDDIKDMCSVSPPTPPFSSKVNTDVEDLNTDTAVESYCPEHETDDLEGRLETTGRRVRGNRIVQQSDRGLVQFVLSVGGPRGEGPEVDRETYIDCRGGAWRAESGRNGVTQP